MEEKTKFSEKRDLILETTKKGVESNVPFSSLQNKYIKNLLLFALMNASTNETVTERNFIKLVNKLFKGYFLKIIRNILDDEDGEFDEALDVSFHKILVDAKIIDINALAKELSPSQIIAFIKANTNGLSQKQILQKILKLRDMKSNHRETPEEQREREQRQKEHVLTRQRQRMMNERGLQRYRSR